jgi:hypothetical protein
MTESDSRRRSNVKILFSREFRGREVQAKARVQHCARARLCRFPHLLPVLGVPPPPSCWGSAVCCTHGSGRGHVSAASGVIGPALPAGTRLAAAAAYESGFLVCSAWSGQLALFLSAENRRWRRWHLSAPWRYSCCPASLAAQVAAWSELVSGEPLSHGRWCWGEEGCGRGGGLALRRPVATGRGNQSTTHVYPAAKLLRRNSQTFLSCSWQSPKTCTVLPATSLIRPCPCSLSQGSRTGAKPYSAEQSL